MKQRLRKTAFPLLAAALALLGTACENPSGDNGTPGTGFTTPAQYRAMILATPDVVNPITITGSSAYYYDTSSDNYKGVFIENRTVTLSPFQIARYETTYELVVRGEAVGDRHRPRRGCIRLCQCGLRGT